MKTEFKNAVVMTNHNTDKISVKSRWDNKFNILRIEVKSKIQSPQVTSKQSPFETADTRKGKSKIAGKKK